MASDTSQFPIAAWSKDMEEAVEQITRLGQSILEKHRLASQQAEENAERWHLAQRLEDERHSLRSIITDVRQIIETIDACHQGMHTESTSQDDIRLATIRCADTISQRLDGIENAFATVRHAALDLLQWTQRSARIEGSTLPDEYRASYARLIAYAPALNPLMAAFQQELLQINQRPGLHPDTQRLISILSRYNAVMHSARGFVRSVVEPPLELAFHETQSFYDDFQALPREQMTLLATELNDCCQLLLYDPVEFRRRVEQVRPQLVDGIEASMVVLTVSGGYKVIFTADEDPVFDQLSITLLRAIPEDQLTSVTETLTRDLYGHFF